MSEMKHQFHVGDWVNLKPIMLHQQALKWVYKNNPHKVVKVWKDGNIQIDAFGMENAFFNPRCFEPAELTNTPIDDLI